jgi:NAD-dependent deacetylase
MHGELLSALHRLRQDHRLVRHLTGNESCPTCAIEASCARMSSGSARPLRLDALSGARRVQGVYLDRHSGSVEPAASFVEEARRAGAHTVELNLEPSQSATLFAERIYGPASKIVPEFVATLLKGQ